MHNLKVMEAAFYQSESDQPHPGRARALIKAHPEVRQLMVRNPWTALIAVSIVVLVVVAHVQRDEVDRAVIAECLLVEIVRVMLLNPASTDWMQAN